MFISPGLSISQLSESQMAFLAWIIVAVSQQNWKHQMDWMGLGTGVASWKKSASSNAFLSNKAKVLLEPSCSKWLFHLKCSVCKLELKASTLWGPSPFWCLNKLHHSNPLSNTFSPYSNISSSRLSIKKSPLSICAYIMYVCTRISSRISTHNKDIPEIKSVVNDPRLTPALLSVVVEEVSYVGFCSHLSKRSIEGCPFFRIVLDADGNVSKLMKW